MPNSEQSAETQWSNDFRDILAEELKRVGEEVSDADPDPIKHAHQKQLVGLAFSGGGIRSATFNLGILQALARMKLLSKFDYLSTVSGGGYIGSWLMAWIKRSGIKDVRAGLRPERGKQPGDDEPQHIHFLRRFSNYLTPKLGWFGADMWTVMTIYIRNVVLNFIVLGAAFAFGSAGAAVDSTRSPAGLEGSTLPNFGFASLRCAFRSDNSDSSQHALLHQA